MSAVTLTPETQQMVAEAMAATGHATADALVRDAVRALLSPDAADLPGGVPTDPMPDAEFDALLDAAIDESERDEGVPWEQVRAELMARYNIPPDALGR